MQNATCEVHLDPNPKFHQQPLSARHQQPGDARAMGSPDTRFTYLDARAPMFDTVPDIKSPFLIVMDRVFPSHREQLESILVPAFLEGSERVGGSEPGKVPRDRTYPAAIPSRRGGVSA